MQLRESYPTDTVGGACFITGRYELDDDEKVIDCDINLDAKPAWGRVCISAEAVRQMGVLLGWDMSPRKDKQMSKLREAHAIVMVENQELREALRSVIDAAQVGRLLVADDEAAAAAEAEAKRAVELEAEHAARLQAEAAAEAAEQEAEAERAARQEAEDLAAAAEEEAAAANRSRAATKGHLTRQKNAEGE